MGMTPCSSTGNDHHHHHHHLHTDDDNEDDLNNSNDATTSRTNEGDYVGHTTHQNHHNNGNGIHYSRNEKDEYCDQVYSSDRCRFINSTPDAQFNPTTTSTSTSTKTSTTTTSQFESFAVNIDTMTPTLLQTRRPNLSNCESLSDLSASRHEASRCDAIERDIQTTSSWLR